MARGEDAIGPLPSIRGPEGSGGKQCDGRPGDLLCLLPIHSRDIELFHFIVQILRLGGDGNRLSQQFPGGSAVKGEKLAFEPELF